MRHVQMTRLVWLIAALLVLACLVFAASVSSAHPPRKDVPMSADDPHGPAILCYDGSESAARAIRLAHHILRDRHPALLLFIHVPTEASSAGVGTGHDAPVVGPAEAEDILARGLQLAREAGFSAEALRVEADRKTAAIILDLAEERDADVIVMGQRGRSGLRSALLGSVSREVINAYHRPVLVV